MDGARLIAGAIALASCRGASADPTPADAAVAWSADPRHGVDVPNDWRELTDVADAASAAAAAHLRGLGAVRARAWGELSRGCYLAIVEAHGEKRDQLATVLEELRGTLDGAVALTAWESSPDSEEVARIDARFTTKEGRPLTGLVRAHLVLDGQRFPHAVAAACFYNDRQPRVCDDTCAGLLTMLQPLEPPS